MRSRITILCGVLLFSVMFATPAHASRWSAFLAWLSDLDPKSGGAGIELALKCAFAPDADAKLKEQFGCAPRGKSTVTFKTSAALLFGTLNEDGGTIFVAPILAIVEKRVGSIYVGGGAGFIHVGGTLEGGITRALLQARVTVPIRDSNFGFRAEFNVIPEGFPAGAFGVGRPETGTEYPVALSIVYWPGGR
jgi:hypothetical protein